MRETIQNATGKQFHAVSLSGGKDSSAMAVFRVERTRDYTVMCKPILFCSCNHRGNRWNAPDRNTAGNGTTA